MADRYSFLKVTESMDDELKFLIICEELKDLMRICYEDLPRITQKEIVDDIVRVAKRFQRNIRRGASIDPMRELKLSVDDSSIATRKKNKVNTEFQRAEITWVRRSHNAGDGAGERDEFNPNYPDDPMLLVFQKLDLHSLMKASQVCKAWRGLSLNSDLWRSIYKRDSSLMSTVNQLHAGPTHQISNDWQATYTAAHQERAWSLIFNSNRAYCRNCRHIIFVSDLHNIDSCHRVINGAQPQPQPSTSQVDSRFFSADSSVGGPFSSALTLWAVPM